MSDITQIKVTKAVNDDKFSVFVTVSYQFTHVIHVDIVNTLTVFAWRLRSEFCGHTVETGWYQHYAGILTLNVGTKWYGLVTGYFTGMTDEDAFDEFVPFEIIKGKRIL